MSALQLKEIHKTYPNGHQAVKGISLDITPGEFLVLVGPSGCGKSTLLRSIAGLESLSEGEIHIAEQRVDKLAPAKRDIAMVFQNYALYPHMTVYKNMAYGLKNRGIDAKTIDQKVREASQMLQLEDYLDRKPTQLSGGQRQRVAMGRAMVRSPKLFLFDEPLSNLDARLRAEMRLEIKRLQRNLGTTSVFVTHDQVEAMTLADRIVIMNQGKVEQIGTPKAVYNHPASVFVATFLGAPAMNILTATCVDKNRLKLTDNQIVNIPRSWQGSLNKGQSVLLGVRPEHLILGDKDDDHSLLFEVGLSEELGNSQLLHGTVAGENCTLNLPQFAQHNNGQLAISFASEALHLFDAATGTRLPDKGDLPD